MNLEADARDSISKVQFISLKEKISSCQSLLCILQALYNRSVTIELKNEITIEGKVVHVDSRMK